MKTIFLSIVGISLLIGLIVANVFIWRENKRWDLDKKDSDLE